MKTAKQDIDSLLHILLKEKTVQALRKGLDQLVKLMKFKPFRHRLAAESGGKASSVVLKRQALSLLWQNILSVAVHALKVLKTKKPQSLEYSLFAQLLTSYSLGDVTEKDVRPRLSLEVLGKVRDFAFSLFKEDKIVDVAESDLFQILHAICSRRDFVGIFRPGHFDEIMDILEPRLDVEKSQEHGFDFQTVQAAAQTLNVLVTTSATIGISMHDHVAECMMWVARRCKAYVKKEADDQTSQEAAIALLRTATTLMRSEPDHAIGPLRTYGNVMMGIARRMYQKTAGADKDAVIGYLTAHM